MVAARCLHELFGAQMLPWLIGVNGLTRAALEAVRASLELEDALVLECREAPPPPWGTMERVSPLLYTWAQGQTGMLRSWLDRILAGEEWARVSKQRAGGSRSVVETIKIATETLEALFDMRLAVPAGVVRSLVEGVDGALARCATGGAAVRQGGELLQRLPPIFTHPLLLAAGTARRCASRWAAPTRWCHRGRRSRATSASWRCRPRRWSARPRGRPPTWDA